MADETKDSLLGATISGVYGSAFFGKAIDEKSLAFWLKLGDGSGLRVSCAPDGESITIDREFPWPCDMQNGGGVLLKDESYTEPWKTIVGAKVVSTYDVVESTSGKVIGFGILVDTGRSVYTLNLGDELWIFDSPDAPVFKQNALSILKRTGDRNAGHP